jgi:hemin uptake protein HemP
MKAKLTPAGAFDIPCINLEEWMQGFKKIVLKHDSRPYYLTITRKGNLILTAATETNSTQNSHNISK